MNTNLESQNIEGNFELVIEGIPAFVERMGVGIDTAWKMWHEQGGSSVSRTRFRKYAKGQL